MKIGETIKQKLISWLMLDKNANPMSIRVLETMDFETNVFKNKMWYRGDASELHQFYTQYDDMMGNVKFWQSTSSNSVDFRKMHSGLPSLIIDTLADITFDDMNEFEFDNNDAKELWENIEKELPNDFIKNSFKKVMYLGDGAIRFVYHPHESKYPIAEFYEADKVDFIYKHGKIHKIIFKMPYIIEDREFTLKEIHTEYGYTYELENERGVRVPIRDYPEFSGLKSFHKNSKYFMCVPIILGESSKYDGRGKSLIDGKEDSFDAFDEAHSQIIEASRDNRTKQYIPETMIPKDPNTGETLKPNVFDGRFIRIKGQTGTESATSTIDVVNPQMDANGLLTAYTTTLDACLQGLISPSTLGIDVKKLDNAEAQREKEKATLYTRNKIIKVAEKVIPKIVETALLLMDMVNRKDYHEYDINVSFGEYANPSFEAVVETVGKAKQYKIMSNERVVDEMYGDTLDDDEKQKEIERLNNIDGFNTNEPSVNEFDQVSDY